MVKKKDSEEQKAKLVNEIILLIHGVNMEPPKENLTILQRENRDRLESAIEPTNSNNSSQNNTFVTHLESFKARLENKSLETLSAILEEESKIRGDRTSSKNKKVEINQKQKNRKQVENENNATEEILEQGRALGSKANKDKSDVRKKALRGAAIFRFKEEPSFTYGECIEWIKSQKSLETYLQYKAGKIYCDERIKKIITGTKKEALQKPN